MGIAVLYAEFQMCVISNVCDFKCVISNVPILPFFLQKYKESQSQHAVLYAECAACTESYRLLSVLQCVAVCCSVLQCVAVFCVCVRSLRVAIETLCISEGKLEE